MMVTYRLEINGVPTEAAESHQAPGVMRTEAFDVVLLAFDVRFRPDGTRPVINRSCPGVRAQ